MEKIYCNIKSLRESKGMSQDELAELTGYTSRSSIAKIEKGLVDLQQSKIVAFAKALGVTPGELMGLTDVPLSRKAFLDGFEYTPEEFDEIKNFANYVKSKRNEKKGMQHFVDVKEAIDYLEQETSIIAAFNGDTSNKEVILQMANAVYLNRTKNEN